MAQAFIKDSQLRLVFEDGLDDKGKMTFKNKNYNNIKPTATSDGLYAVAEAIDGLQSRALVNVERNDSHLLSQ
ncbi:DUF1659 domain-containing protein [Fredinandcohnia quinoae]|uniref:DUF1659 domain-containing protein n=1 Tax=Fredinandcohnia quinoae TaxID=2918902 RepID=A0AAW5E722_9BACI|nr:DUF1659 domain-containing protein [Fredinandcohnia sp. SECRCQ15]MCH1625196.1 DUF1659 domain-containing protein [Fredinandcohnia sp. SECRCQ15]